MSQSNRFRSAGLLATLFPLAVAAQTPATTTLTPPTGSAKPAYLRLGVGTAYDNAGAYRCTRLALEYAPTLTRHFGVAGRLVGVFGKPSSSLERQLPDQRYRAGFVEVEGMLYPFGTDKRVLLGLGAGGFAGYYRKDTYAFLTATAGRVDSYALRTYSGPYAGYLLSLNLDAAVDARQRWRIGVKATVQNGLNGGRTSTYNLTLARRL
ncbi:hypothetical protein DNI29_21610 [Hymenobacter sediminis]|uniref:hypothetical protein n=1 Tax=Hymenobacter sediminis TaxID=2218621 RepID=UPI000DA65265|nr:hypothetical protein [Hymenobacter sediminis]RPD44309.1 hypothetical protein DNI29_21610 [Hymenobacter sediminis]